MDEENLSVNTKALQKDIKRAKLFAIQHVTRRIKMLKNKRGTDQQVEKNTRKATRFEKELECIKDLKTNVIIRKIDNKDWSDSTTVGGENVQERAMARLISSKPIQDNLKVRNNQNNTHQTQKSSKSRVPLSDPKPSQTTPRKKTSCKVKPKQDNLDLASHISQLRSDSSSDNNSSASDNEVHLERTPTSCFVRTLSSVKEQYTSRLKQTPTKQKENRSCSKLKIDKKPQKERRKSSNRMGQRARQRLWKERYGNKAKHMKYHDKIAKIKHDRKHSEMTSNKSQKPRPETKREKGIKRRENSHLEEPASHPSWEASKRRKLQQNITQTTFQGQKIIFQDSD